MYYNKNYNIFIFDYPLPTLMRNFICTYIFDMIK